MAVPYREAGILTVLAALQHRPEISKTQGNDAGGLNMLSLTNPQDIAETIVPRDAEARSRPCGLQAANAVRFLIITRLRHW